MKHYKFNLIKIFTLTIIMSFVVCPLIKAEESLGMGFGDSNSNSKSPTVVDADSMDMDLQQKLIVLIGHVVVNDGQAIIHADKINIYLKKDEDKSKEGTDKKKQKSDDGMSSEAGAQSVDKIVAIGNVVIERILPDVNGMPQPRQKAVGGQAVYNTKDNTIILTKKPRLIYGDGSYVEGNKITLWRDSDRMKVEGNRSIGRTSKLVLTPQDQQSLDENGAGM